MDRAIEHHTLDFIENALLEMKNNSPNSDHVWNKDYLQSYEDGSTILHRSNMPSFHATLKKLCNSSPTFIEFDNYIRCNDSVKKLNAIIDEGGHTAGGLKLDRASVNLIWAYLDNTTSLEFDRHLGSTIALNFYESIRDQRTWMLRVAVINGFKSNFDKLDLGFGYSIRRISSAEYVRLYFRSYNMNKDSIFPVQEYAIFSEKCVDFNSKASNYLSDPKFRLIIRALRLLAKGSIEAPVTVIDTKNIGALSTMSGAHGRGALMKNIRSKVYEFPEGAFSDLLMLINSIGMSADEKEEAESIGLQICTPPQKEVSIAVGRINSAAERSNAEDEFIDHIIALEALFGDNNDKFPGGITYKIAMRAAVLLETDLIERSKIVSLLKNALRIRGKIVHGASNLSAKEQDIVDQVGVISRRAIIYVIKNYTSKGKNISGQILDELLLT